MLYQLFNQNTAFLNHSFTHQGKNFSSFSLHNDLRNLLVTAHIFTSPQQSHLNLSNIMPISNNSNKFTQAEKNAKSDKVNVQKAALNVKRIKFAHQIKSLHDELWDLENKRVSPKLEMGMLEDDLEDVEVNLQALEEDEYEEYTS